MLLAIIIGWGFFAFNYKSCCAPSFFEVAVIHKYFCALLYWSVYVTFYGPGGLLLGIPCVVEQGCGLLFEVMTYTCVLYNIWVEVFCKSGGGVRLMLEVYFTFDFPEPPVAWSALTSNYVPVYLPSLLSLFSDSVLMFVIYSPCGVWVIMPGSKF